jgi:hypothetical protein
MGNPCGSFPSFMLQQKIFDGAAATVIHDLDLLSAKARTVLPSEQKLCTMRSSPTKSIIYQGRIMGFGGAFVISERSWRCFERIYKVDCMIGCCCATNSSGA